MMVFQPMHLVVKLFTVAFDVLIFLISY